MEETVIVQSQELQQLIQNKLAAAGLSEEHAAIVAEHLVFADASGIHSHGAVRVDYYAERIAKGGMNRTPQITFEETGPSSGIVHGQNGAGQVVVLEATKHAIEMAKRSGIAAV
ncbi:ureidoglycolate dehydrogenase, partial [Listeria monocytogenes]|nr:ureidoglycolate dehydrogenase [Listeria monocytogenes]